MEQHLPKSGVSSPGFLLAFLLLAGFASGAEVVVYPAPAGVAAAEDYRVQVEGKEVFVYPGAIASLASFDFEGPVRVVIRTSRDVKWVDVRPRSLGVEAQFDRNEIRLTLNRPCNLSIELNGESFRRPLFLFANPLETGAPKPTDSNVIYFEPGKLHRPGLIELRDGQTLYIAGGAVVEGSITASNSRNVRVAGRGILKGSSASDSRRRAIQFLDCQQVAVEGITLVDSPTWQIVPTRCQDVTIRNVKIASDNGGDDGIDIVRSQRVRIKGCFIRTKDDCIAIKAPGNFPASMGVKDVRVSGCTFWNAAWGNAIEIGFELRADSISDIVFEDCDIIHVEDGAALSIHNGDFATVSDVRFENIRIEDARQKLFDLAIFLSQYSADRPADPAERQRRYLHGAWDGVLSVTPEQRREHAPHRGQIRNILFKDIAVVDGLFPFSLLCGYDEEHRVEGIIFENLTVHGRKITNPRDARMYMEHAGKVEFR